MTFREAFVRRLCLRLSVGLLLVGGLWFTLAMQALPAHAATTLTVSDCSSDSQL